MRFFLLFLTILLVAATRANIVVYSESNTTYVGYHVNNGHSSSAANKTGSAGAGPQKRTSIGLSKHDDQFGLSVQAVSDILSTNSAKAIYIHAHTDESTSLGGYFDPALPSIAESYAQAKTTLKFTVTQTGRYLIRASILSSHEGSNGVLFYDNGVEVFQSYYSFDSINQYFTLQKGHVYTMTAIANDGDGSYYSGDFFASNADYEFIVQQMF